MKLQDEEKSEIDRGNNASKHAPEETAPPYDVELVPFELDHAIENKNDIRLKKFNNYLGLEFN